MRKSEETKGTDSPSPIRPKRKRRPAKKFSPDLEEEKSPKSTSPRKKGEKLKNLAMVKPQGSTYLI